MAQLDRREQYPIERDEHRDLHENRKAAAKRIDLLRLIKLHHRLVHLLTIVGIHLAHLGQARRDELHFCHRFVARGGERKEDQLDQHGEQDDRHTPVSRERVQLLQQPEERPGDDREPAVVDDEVEAGRRGFQTTLFLRAGIKRHVDLRAGAGRKAHRH